MAGKLRLLVLLATRISGAGIAILSSLYIISHYGKSAAGEYFLYFTISYFIGQIVRFGGENDILSAKSDSDVGQSVSISAVLGILGLAFGIVGQIAMPQYPVFIVALAGVQYALMEIYGDILKRHGRNVTGIIYSSVPVHILIVVISVAGTGLPLVNILALSVSINLLAAVIVEQRARIGQQVAFKADKKHIAEAWHSAFGNISGGFITPLAMWMCTTLFSSAAAADYRIAMRLAMLISFSFFALQQMLLKPLRENGLAAFRGAAHFWKYVSIRVVPIAVLMFLGNMLVGTGLVYFMDEFDQQFLALLALWSAAFVAFVVSSPALLLVTYQRRFAFQLKARLSFQVLSLIAAWGLTVLDVTSGVVMFTLILTSHVWMVNVPASLRMRRFYSEETAR